MLEYRPKWRPVLLGLKEIGVAAKKFKSQATAIIAGFAAATIIVREPITATIPVKESMAAATPPTEVFAIATHK